MKNATKMLSGKLAATAIAVALAGAAAVAQTTARGKPGQVTWRSIGTGHFGAMQAPVFSPHDTKVIVAGVDMGNAFMTRDGGKTWEILGCCGAEPFGNPGYRGMWNCCFDPKRPERIFIGSTHGLYRTTDGGENWCLVLGGKPDHIFGAIAVDSTDPNIVYGANGQTARNNCEWSRGDVWKSTDGGKTWQAVADDIPLCPLGRYTRMVFDPSNPNRFLLLHNTGTYEGLDAP